MTVRSYDLFIGGEWRRGAQAADIKNPYGGDVVARVSEAGPEDVEAAISAAASAAPVLRREAPWKRAALLRGISAGVERRAADLALMICLEAGKPMQYARGEAQRAVETFAFGASEAERLSGELIPLDASRAGQGRT